MWRAQESEPGSTEQECGAVDLEAGFDRCAEAATSVYAVYHRGDLLHDPEWGRVHYDLWLAGLCGGEGISDRGTGYRADQGSSPRDP